MRETHQFRGADLSRRINNAVCRLTVSQCLATFTVYSRLDSFHLLLFEVKQAHEVEAEGQ